MTETGTIFKFERYAIHDGPGIRTVVFLKGCPLRCRWCSSPESWNDYPELGFYTDKCTQCGACVETCLVGAIKTTVDSRIVTDLQLCNNCAECVVVCPTGARRMIGKTVTVDEVLSEIEKDTVFYHRSDGGITLSGGEPTMQTGFVAAILKGCLERGIHTAIETCGHVKWENLEKIMPFLDLVYIDIKHISSERHRELTGKGNELIMTNIEKMEKYFANTPLIVRIPVITGVNDAIEDIKSIAIFIHKSKVVKRIELLPYHRYGHNMYNILSKEYALEKVKVPSKKQLNKMKAIFQSFQVQVQVGG